MLYSLAPPGRRFRFAPRVPALPTFSSWHL